MKYRPSSTFILLVFGIVLGFTAYGYFLSTNLVFMHFDAVSRLNIARRTMDSLTPGLGQLGSIWLPLPQMLMTLTVWMESFWRSGLAGAIPSIVAFSIGGVYLYKMLGFFTDTAIVRLVPLLTYYLNPNLLLLQSMALSESIYITLLVMSVYYLMEYMKDEQFSRLVFSGFGFMLISLTRYEGYAVLLGAVFILVTFFAVRRIPLPEIGGKMVLFGTLAFFGVLMWTLYLWAIFGDPIYWQRAYSQEISSISTEIIEQPELSVTAQPLTERISGAVALYMRSVFFMSGVPLAFLSIVLLPTMIMRILLSRQAAMAPLLLLIVNVGFMVFTLVNGGIDMAIVPATYEYITDPALYEYFEFSSRYGIILLPAIIVVLGWIASRNNITLALITAVVLANLTLPLVNDEFHVYYLLSEKWKSGSATTSIEERATDWLIRHYDSGLILISARQHDPMMFHLGLDYSTYIYEGNQELWLSALDNPQRFARWIVMTQPDSEYEWVDAERDPVTGALYINERINYYYDAVYSDAAVQIFKLKPSYVATNKDHTFETKKLFYAQL